MLDNVQVNLTVEHRQPIKIKEVVIPLHGNGSAPLKLVLKSSQDSAWFEVYNHKDEYLADVGVDYFGTELRSFIDLDLGSSDANLIPMISDVSTYTLPEN